MSHAKKRGRPMGHRRHPSFQPVRSRPTQSPLSSPNRQPTFTLRSRSEFRFVVPPLGGPLRHRRIGNLHYPNVRKCLGGPGRLLSRGSRGPVRARISAYGSSSHGLAAWRRIRWIAFAAGKWLPSSGLLRRSRLHTLDACEFPRLLCYPPPLRGYDFRISKHPS